MLSLKIGARTGSPNDDILNSTSVFSRVKENIDTGALPARIIKDKSISYFLFFLLSSDSQVLIRINYWSELKII